MSDRGGPRTQGDDGIRVSVVVPVYRPGAAIEPLIASLDAQTLPQERFEVLLCDAARSCSGSQAVGCCATPTSTASGCSTS